MTNLDLALMELLRRGLRGGEAEDPGLSPEEWLRLLRKADFHKLLPLVLDQALRLPSLRQAAAAERAAASADSGKQDPASEGRPLAALQNSAVEQACRQAMQENEFLNLLLELRAAGLEPLVVKGPVCRALYPNPLLRPSVDDDLLVPADLAPAFHRFFLAHDLPADDPAADPETAWELSYHKPNSPLYIELHVGLFDPDSEVFRGWNSCFDGAWDRAVPAQIQDVTLKTLCPTDHLLFLILHAFKHFLHSGFGLRIISDIALFAEAHEGEVDFARIRAVCGSLRCLEFTAAVFDIAEKYLGIPRPAAFSDVSVDEAPLLADVLEAGIHGQDVDRLHSANITLGTVADERQGRSAKAKGLRASVFLPADRLKSRYPFLERRPWLLPVAWTKRVFTYLRDRRQHSGVHPTASLRIGRERVALLEKYHIIHQKKEKD